MGGDSTWLICPNTRVDIPNPSKSAPHINPMKRSRSEPTLGTPNSDHPKGAPGGSRLSIHHREKDWANGSARGNGGKGGPLRGRLAGACVFCTERRPPPRALVRGMRVCATKNAIPLCKFQRFIFQMRVSPQPAASAKARKSRLFLIFVVPRGGRASWPCQGEDSS